MRKSFNAATLAAFFVVGTVQAAPATYTVDSTHSFPRFSYSHFGLSTQLSKFDMTTGTLVLDKVAKSGSVDVVIDMKSVNTGFKVLNAELIGEDYFDTAKYPTSTFKSTKVNFDGDKPSTVEGNLTIKGITKPVTLKITSFTNIDHPMYKKEAIGAEATAVIKRSDFNASKYVPYVGDDVTITLTVEAIKQ
jgi:polyisoprenoid-binding protein YceI